MLVTDFKGKAIALLILTGLAASCAPTDQSTETVSSKTLSKSRVVFIEETQTVIHSRINLTGKSRASFEEFRETPEPYGAMYVAKNGSGFAWRSNYFSLEDAKATAQVECEAFLQQNCVLYATRKPVKASEGDFALPVQARGTWEYVLRKTVNGRYIGLAADKAGNYGFAWNHFTASGAGARAVRACDDLDVEKVAETSARVASAREASGFYECRTIGTFK